MLELKGLEFQICRAVGKKVHTCSLTGFVRRDVKMPFSLIDHRVPLFRGRCALTAREQILYDFKTWLARSSAEAACFLGVRTYNNNAVFWF